MTNASGLATTLDDQINVDNAPTWSTAAGTIATIDDVGNATHATITASDAEGDTNCILYHIWFTTRWFKFKFF